MGSYPRSCSSFASVFAGSDATIYVISLNQCLKNALDSSVSRLGVGKIGGGQKIPSAGTQRGHAGFGHWIVYGSKWEIYGGRSRGEGAPQDRKSPLILHRQSHAF